MLVQNDGVLHSGLAVAESVHFGRPFPRAEHSGGVDLLFAVGTHTEERDAPRCPSQEHDGQNRQPDHRGRHETLATFSVRSPW